MRSDAEARRRELLDKAEFFAYAEYPMASKWVFTLADNVRKKNPVTDLEKDLEETINTWKNEYVQGNELRKQRFEAISTILFSAAKAGKLEEQVTLLTPIIEGLVGNI